MPKHTIPDKKNLLVQLMEKNGGRHLKLKITNKTIVKALPFEQASNYKLISHKH